LTCAGAALLSAPAVASRAHDRVRAIARALPGRLGVYARSLAPGPPIAAYNAVERFPTASIIKLLVMTTAFAAEEETAGALSEAIVFRRSQLIGGSDFLAYAQDGQRFTVAQLIRPMITVSDNTAANLLIGHFGFAAINATAKRAGMKRTHLARRFLDYTAIEHHNENLSTPADMGRLLYLIERGAHEGTASIVSSLHCRAMVDIMLRQTDRDGIPAALPPHTVVANKTGEIEGTRNDVAVIRPFGESPLVLAIMTKDLEDYSAAYAAIHAVTRAVYRAP
jgi:beta-lactamase class A